MTNPPLDLVAPGRWVKALRRQRQLSLEAGPREEAMRHARSCYDLWLAAFVLQVFPRVRQAIDAGEDERVAGTEEIEQHLQFATTVAPRTTAFLGADYFAARRLPRRAGSQGPGLG
jgi:hypothetical protein